MRDKSYSSVRSPFLASVFYFLLGHHRGLPDRDKQRSSLPTCGRVEYKIPNSPASGPLSNVSVSTVRHPVLLTPLCTFIASSHRHIELITGRESGNWLHDALPMRLMHRCPFRQRPHLPFHSERSKRGHEYKSLRLQLLLGKQKDHSGLDPQHRQLCLCRGSCSLSSPYGTVAAWVQQKATRIPLAVCFFLSAALPFFPLLSHSP
ncbi:hypothetical protein EJ06DRAFT_77674 [Trichodelitschia bisporula]|uniref:Uncharacterized protein n=1 Tax=Trichodelitschia bisporula TaxID=703511 RepID=A0A6G1HT47_9PEZI|nr:hypothetical protein EJ06DRAFT_77674 [Trichodelitschia bisporula]